MCSGEGMSSISVGGHSLVRAGRRVPVWLGVALSYRRVYYFVMLVLEDE